MLIVYRRCLPSAIQDLGEDFKNEINIADIDFDELGMGAATANGLSAAREVECNLISVLVYFVSFCDFCKCQLVKCQPKGML